MINLNANNKKILLNDENDYNNDDKYMDSSLKILQRNNNNRVNNNIYFTGGLDDETCFKLSFRLASNYKFRFFKKKYNLQNIILHEK